MTGRPQLATEGAGNVPTRMENNPPMQSQSSVSGSSQNSVTVPNNLKGLSAVEYQKLTNVVAAKGLKSDAITNLYDKFGLKAVQNLLKKSDDEITAALKAVELEKLDGGHSIARHGAQLEDQALKDRVITGNAPDGVFSPTPASTRFSNHEIWVKTREGALKEIEKKYGLDLSKPPTSGIDKRQSIIIEYDRPIDEGFVGDSATKKKVVDPSNPKKKGKGYTSVNSIDGITRTKTTVQWDGTTWKVKQHIPWAIDWDNTTKTYSSSPDTFVKLP